MIIVPAIIEINDHTKLLSFLVSAGGVLMIMGKIKDGLRTDFVGKEMYCFKDVTSTNDLAKELASEGAGEGVVVISEKQSSGRGRLGRKWISPEGGIYFSVILRPKMRPKEALKLTFLTAVAVVKAIRKTVKLNARIKWPNDVLINGKKVCGILTEMSTSRGLIDFAVIGVGINANIDVNSLPSPLRSTSTSLMEEMRGEVERERLLRVLLTELENYYTMFTEGGFDLILGEWRDLNCVLGAYVEVVGLEGTVEGRAVDVDGDGALMIELEDGTIRRVISGDAALKSLPQPGLGSALRRP
ncbi:MAG: biotin--[acetyl-CoA-carboxylase] ligase [Candidatus Bathyarchaeia archaeon]